MPELPEVETIKLGLQKRIIGLTINDVEVLNPKTFSGEVTDLKDQKVIKVWRRAKVLGIDLANHKTILFHLKMSGQVIYQKGKIDLAGGHPTPDMNGEMPNRSTRMIFSFADGGKLFFNDQRKFGWVKVLETDSVLEQKFLATLGPEPLEKDFTCLILKSNLLKHKIMPVKVALMDQTVVGGVGNIYASEACFIAKIDPRRRVNSLSNSDFEKLHLGVVESLETGVKYGGSSREHYVNSEGEKGSFLDYAFVYNRDKKECKVCGTEISKITLGGRGTYFCNVCQK